MGGWKAGIVTFMLNGYCGEYLSPIFTLSIRRENHVIPLLCFGCCQIAVIDDIAVVVYILD